MVSPLRLFINYRRDTDLLRAVLVQQFLTTAFTTDYGESAVRVFLDSGMRLGREWPAELRAELAAADIVLALVGPKWLGAKDAAQRRRIDQPDDWVRLEIEYALEHDKIIIPISFAKKLPSPDGLPPSIAGFVSWQSAQVDDATISRDLEPVYAEIRRHLSALGPVSAQPTSSKRLPYPDPPMKLKPAPISPDELALIVAEELSDWTVERGPVPGKPEVIGVQLQREMTFPRFRDVLPYMAIIADFAEKANHHPCWENIFKTLTIKLSTWDIGHQVSILDIVLASYCDKAYLEYVASLSPPADRE